MANLKKVRTIFLEPLPYGNDCFYLDIIASNEMSRQIEEDEEKYSLPLADQAIQHAMFHLPKKESNNLTYFHTSRECSDLFYRFGLELGLCRNFGFYPKTKADKKSMSHLLEKITVGNLTREKCSSLTSSGHMLLCYKIIIPDILLSLLLDYQLPIHEYSYALKLEGDFNVKPFLEFMRLIVDLEGLSRDEVMIYGLQLTNYKYYDEVKDKIKQFRAECPQEIEQYDKYARDCFDKEMLALYKDDIEEMSSQNAGKSFGKITENFLNDLRTKMRVYTESFLRLLHYTAKFNSDGRKIWVAPEFSFEIEYLVEHTDRQADNPNKCQGPFEIINMLFSNSSKQMQMQKIEWWDRCDQQAFRKFIERNYDTSSYKDKTETGYDLFLMRAVLAGPILQQRIKDGDEKLENSFSMYQSVMDMYDDIRNDRLFDAPMYTVWNAHRTFRMFGFVDWVNNFIVDGSYNPFRTKGPRVAMCEFFYDDFVVYIGSLLAEGRIQYEIDGRYYTDVFHSNVADFETKVAYELFLTRSVSTVTFKHCIEFNFDGGCMVTMKETSDGKVRKNEYRHYLVPVSIDHMMQLLTTAKNAKRKVSPKDVKAFLAACVADMSKCKTVKKWNEVVQEHCNNWLDD